jgi:hypothetical protein
MDTVGDGKAIRTEQARRNREQMPELALAVDALRDAFGEVRVLWGRDETTGCEVGTKPVDWVEVRVPDGWHETYEQRRAERLASERALLEAQQKQQKRGKR